MVIVSTFGAIFQWPVGFLSDRIDRRVILIGVTLIASGLSVLIIVSSYLSLVALFIVLAFYAGMSLPMHSLAVAHTNDYLQPDEIVAASSSINILVGIGAILGPIAVSLFMKVIGPDGFFVYIFIVHLLLGFFGLYRMGKRAKPSDIESQYVPLPRNISATGMELNPKVEPTE
jgi:MFS family permease